MSADAAKPRDIIPISDADRLREARSIIRHESRVLEQLAESLDDSFCDAVELIRSRPGRLIVSGVGKAGLIGRKIVATLVSTGTRAEFLHPTEALHGDLGTVAPEDTLLALSNSGESEEVVQLLPAVSRRGIPVIAVTRDRTNRLASASDVVITLGRHPEAGELRLAPTSSTTAMLALGDALALVLSRLAGFGADDFAVHHPGGSLGRRLTPVREMMRSGDALRISCESRTVRDVMIELRRPGRRTGAVILVNADGRLSGLFTDSDLARLFEARRDRQLDRPIREVMTVNPITVSEEMLLPEALEIMAHGKISEIPVVGDSGEPVGILDVTDLLLSSEDEASLFSRESRPQHAAVRVAGKSGA